jgi:adenosylmethionine-8-amino-7-oxononanoate aminotransferase
LALETGVPAMKIDFQTYLSSPQELTSEKTLRNIILDYRQMKHWIGEPFIIDEGDGVRIRDVHGKWYVDGLSGVYVVNAGHNNRRIIEAMKAQLDRFVFAPPMHGVNSQGIRLANILSEIAPGNLKRVKLLSGGSEANEAAIKMAKQYHKITGNHRKYKVFSVYNSYHGATMGAMAATGRMHYRKYFEPLMEGFLHVHPHYCYRCPYDQTYPSCKILCAKMIERTIAMEDPDSVAAFIIEPIIHIGGVLTPPKEFLPMIRDMCSRHNIVLIYDEIITGFGRTGDLFAAITFDAIPDILCCGKGMSSGYQPLAACLIDQGIADAFYGESNEIGFVHGHTYSSFTLAATAGIAAIQELIDRDFPGNARSLETYLRQKLAELDQRFGVFGEIRGKGLLICAELVKDKKTKERFPDELAIGKRIEKANLKNGLLHRAEPHWFTIAPPLIATRDVIDEIIGILERSLEEVIGAL